MLFQSLSALALMLAANIFSVQAQSGGYANSCSGCDINTGSTPPYYLSCVCGNGKGGYQHSSINLSDCFGNEGGTLVFAHAGAFGRTCKNVGIGGAGLFADCGDGKGSYDYTSIQMNKYIGNTGGKLVC